MSEIGIHIENPSVREDLYSHSSALEKLKNQNLPGLDKPVAFFTDIDGTLTRKPLSGETQESVRQETEAVGVYLENASVPIIAVTGRDLPLIVKGQSSDTESLPIFDIAVTSVGTEIYIRQPDGSYKLDEEYKRIIEEDIGFKRTDVYETAKKALAQVSTQHPAIQLEFQPRDREGAKDPQPYKISYNFIGTSEQMSAIQEEYRKILDTDGFTRVHALFSHDNDRGNGEFRWNIDLLPVTKSQAIDYLIKKLGCQAIVAGDSGNDSNMLLQSDASAGIAVGGSKSELRDSISQQHILRPHRQGELRRSRIIEDESGTKKLLFVEPQSSQDIGPASLPRALKFFQRLAKLQTQNNKI